MADNDSSGQQNRLLTHLSEVMARHTESPWSEEIIRNERNRVRVIYNSPGEAVFGVVNPDNEEIWVVLLGQITWRIGDEKAFTARPGDIVYAPRGSKYSVRTTGREPSVRISINAPEAPEPPEVEQARVGRRRDNSETADDG